MPREWKLNALSDKDIPQLIHHTLESVETNSDVDIKKTVMFKEYITGLRNGISHFGQKDSLEFESFNDEISAIKIKGSTNSRGHILKYKFDLTNGNELEKVTSEILIYINKNTRN